MWIFTTIGFFDLVANREKEGWIIVKARCEADIWNLYEGYRDRFPMQKPVSNPAWDYRWGIPHEATACVAAGCATRERD
jgi:hypothetical protein